jgi:hypothetical protein
MVLWGNESEQHLLRLFRSASRPIINFPTIT